MSQLSEFEERRAELIAEINEAFDGVTREDGITLHEGVAIDDYKSSEERIAARRLDQEKRWQDVPDKDVIVQIPSPARSSKIAAEVRTRNNCREASLYERAVCGGCEVLALCY